MRPPGPAAPGVEPGRIVQPAEQLRYARWLEWGTRFGLALLVVLFVAYAAGLVEPHVPHSRLPEVWNLPVSQFLAATALPAGWTWLDHVHRGDIANLVGICLLAGISVLALAALVPLYLRRGDRVYAALCITEMAVLLLAASGLLAGGH